MSHFGQQVNKYLIAFQQGDEAKFRDLYYLTVNYMRRVAYKHVIIKANCEDVISEAYQRVYRHIDTFDPTKDGFNWLYTITVNVAKTINVEESKYKTVDIDLVDVGNGRDEYGISDARIDVFAALHKLDEIEYEIAEMYYYVNITQEQIGQILGMTRSAVNQRLKQIRKKLSQIYKKP